MAEVIDYRQLMHKAMQRVLFDVLSDVAKAGLPGKHHFFITFDTSHPGVDISEPLRKRFPDEMQIVMQDWFENLSVMDDRFFVTLNFDNVPEPLVIPFDAIKTFVDPSVEFGLRFDAYQPSERETKPADQTVPTEAPKDADVVSLDTFRKP